MTIKLVLRALPLTLLLIANPSFAAHKARNVILFLGDAGGMSTLNAAGIYAHDKPQQLYIQSMPHFALSDTSSLDSWVTDSAAGMSAIVTGRKTNNGMISSVPGENGDPAQPVKSIVEYAEERGLSTGVVTNMPAWDATPAACYAHVDSRSKAEDIYSQLVKPRYGDGVDILIGTGRKPLDAAFEKQSTTAAEALQKSGYRFFESPDALSAGVRRAVSIFDGLDFAPIPVVDAVIDSLSANHKGYFLMVEWDMHPIAWKQHALGEKGSHYMSTSAALERVAQMDDLIRHVSKKVGKDTLIIFAADHSLGLRMRQGKRGKPFAEQFAAAEAVEGTTQQNNPMITVDQSHTGEEILVAAQGPGAERVQGFIPNTRIFEIMLAAYGWKPDRR